MCVIFLRFLSLDREYSLTMALTQQQGDPGSDKKKKRQKNLGQKVSTTLPQISTCVD